MAVERINSMGGVKVGGKTYKFEIIYYDDESNPKKSSSTCRKINLNKMVLNICLDHTVQVNKSNGTSNREIWSSNG